MQNPASNHYTYDELVQSKYTKVPKANMKRDMTVRSPERKKDNGPSPVSYPEKETKWTGLSTKVKIPQFTIKKAKNNCFLDLEVKKSKGVPGVGTHKGTTMEQFNLLARGPSPHYKRGI